MGGGKKKQSLKQMTKQKASKGKKQKDKTSFTPVTKKTLGISIPDLNDKKVLGELKGLKILTPSVIASRYNVRLSIANSFLKELEKRKIIEFVSGGKNLKIYRRIK